MFELCVYLKEKGYRYWMKYCPTFFDEATGVKLRILTYTKGKTKTYYISII